MKNLLKKIFSIKSEEYYTEIKFLNKTFRHIKAKRLIKDFNKQQEFIRKAGVILNNGINKEKISYEIERFNSLGIMPKSEKGGVKLIVTLTSYPDRMYDIHYSVYSLLKQSKKPDMVILYLAEEQFPNKEADLPQKLLKFKENGLTIKWCKDLKSYKKLIPALKEFPNDIIVTADDDIFYPENWLLKLYEAYLKNPEFIHAHRVHKITFEDGKIRPYTSWKGCINDNSADFINFPTTGGGVLYPPKSLSPDVLNEELFLNLAPNADDIWFFAMAVLNNTKIKVVHNPVSRIKQVNPKRDLGFYDENTLYISGNGTGGNDIQLNNILEHYPSIKDRILIQGKKQYVFEKFGKDIYSHILFLDHKFAYDYIRNFINKDSTILEIGSGDGFGTHYLSKFCKHIEGVDISESAVNLANSKYKNEKCNFKLYDGKNLEYQDKSFDIVISFHVVEHVKNVKEYLNNIKRVLKDGGICILTTPSRTYRLSKGQKPWNPEHLREYDAKALNKDIKKVFENFKISGISAKQEILDIEFNRVAPNRTDFKGMKEINLNIDYINEFSIEDFYISNKNADLGTDLIVICKKEGGEINSKLYWENRYLSDGTSGAGSYGRLADFKAEIINNFVKNHEIKNVIEFGSGDGNQLKLLNFKQYTGFDVSEIVLNKCKKEFSDKSNYTFKNAKDYNGETADLVLSLDVIYHLIEDCVFYEYMENLFSAAEKFVIIYASNKNENHCPHVKHRKFTDWIEQNQNNITKGWVLKEKIENKYKYSPKNTEDTSFADFYIFEKL